MTYEISKIIVVKCDQCGTSETYEYEPRMTKHDILLDIRHRERWTLCRSGECVCPDCSMTHYNGRRRKVRP